MTGVMDTSAATVFLSAAPGHRSWHYDANGIGTCQAEVARLLADPTVTNVRIQVNGPLVDAEPKTCLDCDCDLTSGEERSLSIQLYAESAELQYSRAQKDAWEEFHATIPSEGLRSRAEEFVASVGRCPTEVPWQRAPENPLIAKLITEGEMTNAWSERTSPEL